EAPAAPPPDRPAAARADAGACCAPTTPLAARTATSAASVWRPGIPASRGHSAIASSSPGTAAGGPSGLGTCRGWQGTAGRGDSVAPSLLHPVHRSVRLTHQLLLGAAVEGKRGQSETGGDRQREAVGLQETVTLQRRAQSVRDDQRLRPI